MPINTPGIVPIWEDHLSTVQPLADIKAWANTPIPSSDYFLDDTFTRGGIPKITSGTEYMVPTKGPMLVMSYSETMTIEDNTQDFYAKQDMLFYSEAAMVRDWIYAIEHKSHEPVIAAPIEQVAVASNNVTYVESNTPYIFGPYIDLSLQSEANKYYGISESKKSSWLQRSLTRGLNFVFISRRIQRRSNIVESHWVGTVGDSIGAPTYDTYTAASSLGPTAWISAYQAYLIAQGHPTWTVVFLGLNPETTGVPNEEDRAIYFNYRVDTPTTGVVQQAAYKPADLSNLEIGNGNYYEVLPANQAVYIADIELEQQFINISVRYTYYDICIYKQLGYTKIKGHGHYVN